MGQHRACRRQIGGVVDQFGCRVQVTRRGPRPGEVLAQRGRGEVDPFHDRDGPAKVPCDELSGAGVLPVVAYDPVAFAQEVGKLRIGQKRFRHDPGGLHRGSQPGTGLLAARGNGLELGLYPADLRGLALALHEQDAAGLDRAVIVQIRCPGIWAGRGFRDGLNAGPSFRKGDERASCALQQDSVGQRGLGVVLLVLAVVSREILHHRQQAVALSAISHVTHLLGTGDRSRRPQRDERPGADEGTRSSNRAKISPAKDRGEQARPVRVPVLELGQDGHAFVLGQEPLAWCEGVPPDLDPERRMSPDVTDPVGVLAPGRADDCLVSARVVAQDHGHGGVGLARLPARVNQQQERVVQEPAPSPAIQRQRQPEYRQSEATRPSPKPKERRYPTAGLLRCDSAFHDHRPLFGREPADSLTQRTHGRGARARGEGPLGDPRGRTQATSPRPVAGFPADGPDGWRPSALVRGHPGDARSGYGRDSSGAGAGHS